MNILVLGGTGAMGTHVVKLLAELGHDVYVTSRKRKENADHIFYSQGDAHDMQFLQSLLMKCHYDAIIDFMTYTTSDFKARYAIFLECTNQYFLLSTSRVYANYDGRITESSPRLLDVVNDSYYLKTDEYALCKARQEDILRSSGKTNWTIIRPYKTYSENRLQLGSWDKDTVFQRAMSGRSIVVSEDVMSHTTTLTYGQDVAKCIIRLIGNNAAFGETFHIATQETIPWMDVLSIYKEEIESYIGGGKSVNVVMMKRSPQLDTPVGRFQIMYDLHYDRMFDNSKLLDAIGCYEFTPIKDGLRHCVRAFLSAPYFGGLSGSIEGVHDHFSHEFTPLGCFSNWHERRNYIVHRFFPVYAKINLKLKQINNNV